MKKYASLLLFALLLNGCDDGDLTVDSVDFEDISIQSCDPLLNTLLYKLKDQESLLLQLPLNTLKNDATTIGDPTVINIDSQGNGSYRFLYRAYDGTVATANICNAIPPKAPNVTEEWLATSGQIVISSVQITEEDATTKATKITGYTHDINLKNVTFLKPSGPTQVQEDFPFGTYKTTITTPIVVTFTDANNARYCSVQQKIYNENGTTALVIKNLDPALIKPEATPVGVPRTGLINATATTNNVNYEIYSSTLPINTSGYFCTSVTQTTPTVQESWAGKAGVNADNTGIIEVTTTEETNLFRHKIILRSTTLQKGNSSFMLGTSFLVGSITINK